MIYYSFYRVYIFLIIKTSKPIEIWTKDHSNKEIHVAKTYATFIDLISVGEYKFK